MDADINKPVCNICGKLFGRNAQRNKHLYNVHKINSKGKKVADNSTFFCELCGRFFKRKENLANHVTAIHCKINPTSIFECKDCNYKTIVKRYLKSHMKIHELSHMKIDELRKESPQPLIKCTDCNASYKCSDSLRRHHRKAHNTDPVKPIIRKCPICSFVSTARSRREMYTHLQKIHYIHLTWETYKFENLQLFHEWKTKLEKETKTFFRTQLKLKLYVCNRSGYFTPRGKGLRHMKEMGTCKINAFCPSQIKMKLKENGHVEAKYLPCHVGHKNELKHIRLTRQERESIACQLLNGTPGNHILKRIRKSLTDFNTYRIHLLNKQDMRNIVKSFNIKKDPNKVIDENCEGTRQTVKEDILNEVCVEDSIDHEETAKRKLEEDISMFVDYIKKNANSREQMEFVRNYIKQAKFTLAAMASTSTDVIQKTSWPENTRIVPEKRLFNRVVIKKIGNNLQDTSARRWDCNKP